MRLTLIGMSGSGKSFWSKRLHQSSFRRFCCDDLIAARLLPESVSTGDAITVVGRWMGFPFEPPYKEREAAYLAAEMAVMIAAFEALEDLERDDQTKIVIDTTGSVIYTGEHNLMRLRSLTTIVHLETPSEIQQKKLEAYIKQPRPILWRDLFHRLPGETNVQAMARCYPLLLASREDRYRKFAHVTISYYHHRRPGFTVRDFLGAVSSARDQR